MFKNEVFLAFAKKAPVLGKDYPLTLVLSDTNSIGIRRICTSEVKDIQTIARNTYRVDTGNGIYIVKVDTDFF